MEITLDILNEVLPNAEFINFIGDEEFDYINIAKIEGQNPDTDKHLFFAIHDIQPWVDGWFIDKIDRRIIFPKVTYDKPHWTFVIEKEIKDKLNPIVKAIVVDNINEAIKLLYKFVLDIVNPKVCAVTGSVGKTTTVCLLEDIVSLKYKCIRVYRFTGYNASFLINTEVQKNQI